MSTKNERISNQSMDLGEFNKERLLEMFPIFRTEGGGVDFDRLKLVLGESVEVGKEVFGMRWPGKANSIRLANTPSHGTLSPAEEESVNFDTTQNLIIEGDNLEVLKLLQKSYQGKVKMIYIDPPYNTGNDFVYEDDFADGIKNYLQQTGQIDGEGNRLSTNSETDGRFHSNWMNMMFPRLYLAQNLLREDGALIISIDDFEYENLKHILVNVFGQENIIATLIWSARTGGQDTSDFARQHEYLLFVAKNRDFFSPGRILVGAGEFPLTDESSGRRYKRQLARKWGSNSKRADRPNLFYPVLTPDGRKVLPLLPNGEDGCWRWGQTRMKLEIDSGNVEFSNDLPNPVAYERIWEPEGGMKSMPYSTVLTSDEVGTTATGTADLGALFGGSVFSYPKSVDLLGHVMAMSRVLDGDVVLDFFAGSGTTAHAVMAQNAKDGGNRKFILVQLPEQVDPESEAAKAGFGSIADITKERVRRAGKKIIEESDGKLNLNGEDALDFGFRVLKLSESNIEDWNSEEASKSPKDLFDALKTTRLKSGRSEKDVVFEVLVKFGIELTSKVEEKKVGKGTVWKIGGGELLIVVSAGLTVADLNSIVKMAPKVVVMLDEAFTPESLKTNARAVFKDAKIELKTF